MAQYGASYNYQQSYGTNQDQAKAAYDAAMAQYAAQQAQIAQQQQAYEAAQAAQAQYEAQYNAAYQHQQDQAGVIAQMAARCHAAVDALQNDDTTDGDVEATKAEAYASIDALAKAKQELASYYAGTQAAQAQWDTSKAAYTTAQSQWEASQAGLGQYQTYQDQAQAAWQASQAAYTAAQYVQYGQVVYVHNQYGGLEGGWLDVNGLDSNGGAILGVSTAKSPTRDGMSGSWVIRSPAGKTGPVQIGDQVYMENQYVHGSYTNGATTWLDINGYAKQGGGKYGVSTTGTPTRDGQTGTWMIEGGNGAGQYLGYNDVIQFRNFYQGGAGGYLDVNGYGGDNLGVCTADSANRDNGSGSWSIQRAA